MAFTKTLLVLIPLFLFVGCSSGQKKQRADLLNQLGLQNLSDDRPVEAVRAFREALTIYPENPEFHNNLGIAYAAQGDEMLAERSFRKALEINNRFTAAIMNLGLLYSDQNKFVLAQDLLKRASLDMDFSDRPKAVLGLARLALKRDNRAEAEKFYDQLTRIDPKNCMGNLEYGRLLHQQNRSRIAIKYLSIASDGVCFSQREAHVRLAQAYTEVGEMPQAVKVWTNIKKNFPGTSEADEASRQLVKR